MGAGCNGLVFFVQKWMEKRPNQNGYLFIHFVTFTSTLVVFVVVVVIV